MIDMSEIDRVEDWLIGQALHSPDMPKMFGELCEKLAECEVPISRALLAWATLHPLIEAETAFWEAQVGIEHHQFTHTEEEQEDWLKSPMRSALMERKDFLRRRLEGGNAELDYPLCVELSAKGYTDYMIITTGFDMPAISDMKGNTGIIVSWATQQAGGFSDGEVAAIHYIQKRLALAARANLEAQVTQTIAETYLGQWAGSRVLNGQIRHGDGETINAVIFYCDMRNSTRIAEDLGPERYLKFLNTYFEATGGPVLAHGGEILDFIGDAVLGVFPITGNDLGTAVERALAAADELRERIAALNGSESNDPHLTVGLALSVGEVMFGNIGVANRLTFSVIGQTVHAAARMETLTKKVHRDILMTAEIAALASHRAEPVGAFALDGFAVERPLFALSTR
ncbi:adenylate/guanylate cyclase domain-containing protein [uncultured Roseibium sp.]|uniref:adenylate/guanylate cyclase domain-containing protein n=1 Tax=uncultured Roseibium sp. TaxID=1936171 RepID=UPI0025999B9F|nr:adenylate/guanylate cyclase domain-containing protein [uncultured Roseibium sp.]